MCIKLTVTLFCLPTVEQDEFVAVAALQRVLQDVLQGPVEEQNLLPALRLPKTRAALLGHVVKCEQRCGVLHRALMALVTHTCTCTLTEQAQRWIHYTHT